MLAADNSVDTLRPGQQVGAGGASTASGCVRFRNERAQVRAPVLETRQPLICIVKTLRHVVQVNDGDQDRDLAIRLVRAGFLGPDGDGDFGMAKHAPVPLRAAWRR